MNSKNILLIFKSPGLPKQFQGSLQINIESSGSINVVQMKSHTILKCRFIRSGKITLMSFKTSSFLINFVKVFIKQKSEFYVISAVLLVMQTLLQRSFIIITMWPMGLFFLNKDMNKRPVNACNSTFVCFQIVRGFSKDGTKQQKRQNTGPRTNSLYVYRYTLLIHYHASSFIKICTAVDANKHVTIFHVLFFLLQKIQYWI